MHSVARQLRLLGGPGFRGLPGRGGRPPAPSSTLTMEPLLLAWSYFRRRKFQLCADLCTQMLEKSPYDQVLASSRCGVRGVPRPRAGLTIRSPEAPGARPCGAAAGGSFVRHVSRDRKFCALIAPSSQSSAFPPLYLS
ncbi:hypothetical protein P7K49_018438 [Saguinus oedipus]|uniref:Uncharacterized protein n=1 Tax=Saguinus oedipus TaxID=9490 RepID=A0ABQ9V5D2_SAGOE|nr:hypothetical protein P7K49_018438 [Saguinus oedipus]